MTIFERYSQSTGIFFKVHSSSENCSNQLKYVIGIDGDHTNVRRFRVFLKRINFEIFILRHIAHNIPTELAQRETMLYVLHQWIIARTANQTKQPATKIRRLYFKFITSAVMMDYHHLQNKIKPPTTDTPLPCTSLQHYMLFVVVLQSSNRLSCKKYPGEIGVVLRRGGPGERDAL